MIGPGERGVTLIELLVAMLLLSVGLLAVAPMFVSAARQNAAAADAGIVGALAVDRMEQLRMAPYATLPAGGDLEVDANVAGTPYFDRSNPGYVVRWSIADGATPDGGRTIAVRTIAVPQRIGEPKEITLRTIRTGD